MNSANQLKTTIKFDENAIEYLINLPWRGNVRELRNVVERLMILAMKSKLRR